MVRTAFNNVRQPFRLARVVADAVPAIARVTRGLQSEELKRYLTEAAPGEDIADFADMLEFEQQTDAHKSAVREHVRGRAARESVSRATNFESIAFRSVLEHWNVAVREILERLQN